MNTQKESITFHITIQETDSNGRKIMKFVGKPFHSRFQLKKALKRVKLSMPEAKSGRFVAYY